MSKFNIGDRVKCIDAGPNAYIATGKEYTVLRVKDHGDIGVDNGKHFHYGDHRFELAVAKPAAPKLKLPLVLERASGRVFTVVAGTEAGRITMIDTETGSVFVNSETEDYAIDMLMQGVWTARGVPENAPLAEAVAKAKAELAAAEAALAAHPLYLV